MRLANKGISSFNRGRIRAEGQGLVRSELHDAPPTSHLSSTLIIIHYSIFISHPQAAESSVCNGQLCQGGEFHSDAARHLLKSRLILNSLRSGGLNLPPRCKELRIFSSRV